MSAIQLINTPQGFVETHTLQPSTFNPSEKDILANEPRSRVYSGAIRHTAGQDDEVTGTGVTRYTHSTAGIPGGGILASLSSTYGRPSVEIEPGNPASRTDVRTAERMGLIKADGRGGWEDVRGTDGTQRTHSTVEAEKQQLLHQQDTLQQQATHSDTEGVFSESEDEHWRTTVGAVPEHVFRPVLASMTNAVVLGEDFDTATRRLVQDSGMEPDQAAGVVNTAAQLQQNIVDRALEKVGLSGEALEAFYVAARNDPRRLGNALQYLMHGRDVSHFQQWGREFAATRERRATVEQARQGTPHDASAVTTQSRVLEAAGFTVSKDSAGVPVARRDNGAWRRVSDILSA